MLGITNYGSFCAAILLFLVLPGPGTFALLPSTGKGGLRAGAATTRGSISGDPALLWPAVAGVAALLDPTRHQGSTTFAVMTLTIATMTAAYCLTLCAFARAIGERIQSHRSLARLLQRTAGVFPAASGIKLGTP